MAHSIYFRRVMVSNRHWMSACGQNREKQIRTLVKCIVFMRITDLHFACHLHDSQLNEREFVGPMSPMPWTWTMLAMLMMKLYTISHTPCQGAVWFAISMAADCKHSGAMIAYDSDMIDGAFDFAACSLSNGTNCLHNSM